MTKINNKSFIKDLKKVRNINLKNRIRTLLRNAASNSLPLTPGFTYGGKSTTKHLGNEFNIYFMGLKDASKNIATFKHTESFKKNKFKVRETKSSRLRRQSVLNLNQKKEKKATSWQNSHIRGR